MTAKKTEASAMGLVQPAKRAAPRSGKRTVEGATTGRAVKAVTAKRAPVKAAAFRAVEPYGRAIRPVDPPERAAASEPASIPWHDVVAHLDLDPDEVAAEKERILAQVRAYRLREIRKASRLTQRELADMMGVDQTRVSQIERGELERFELATLEAYVEALGGRVRVVADFGDYELRIA